MLDHLPLLIVSAPNSGPIGFSKPATVASGPGNRLDWVGLIAMGSPNSARLDWKYLNGSQTPPGVGVTGAVVPFNMPAPAGQYQFRFFFNDSTTLLATSSSFSTLGASVLVSATTAPGGSSITASITSGPGNPADWVGLYAVSVANPGGWINWNYLNGTRTQPGAGLTSANLPFSMPTTPGQYQLRLYSNNSGTLLATSLTIDVTAASVGVSTTSATIGATVTASITGGPGKLGDWVGLYAVNSTDSAYVTFKYLSGTTTPPTSGLASASIPFTMPSPPGQYEFRFFDSVTRIATSAAITVSANSSVNVTPTAVTAGSSVTASIAGGPGKLGDWVGLFAVNSADSAFLAWKYLSGTTTPPNSGLTSASFPFTMPVTPGQYQLRFFDSSFRLATSATITVSPASVNVSSWPKAEIQVETLP